MNSNSIRTTIKIKTDTTVEPVTLAEAKIHLHVGTDETEQDDYISTLIKVARTSAEIYTGRTFCAKTYNYYLDGFPGNVGAIYLPYPPLLSATAVTSIAYFDSDGVSATLDSDYYQIDHTAEPAIIVPDEDDTWPSTQAYKLNAVNIEYTGGYGTTAASVPAPLKQAILLLVGLWFENREQVSVGTVNEIPYAARMLMSHYEVPIL